MTIEDLFVDDGILLGVDAKSKKQLFQVLSAQLVSTGALGACALNARDIALSVMERERLGSTGVGSGVAIPHARLEGLDKVMALFARLETPLDYDAVDDRPVDLVIMLVAPAHAGGDHLRALAQVSRLLRRTDMRQRLRAAPNPEAVLALLKEGRQTGEAA